jgi:hypothetical protein
MLSILLWGLIAPLPFAALVQVDPAVRGTLHEGQARIDATPDGRGVSLLLHTTSAAIRSSGEPC